MKFTLRSKIAITFSVVILSVGLLTTITGIQLLGSGVIREAQNKIKLDLNSASEIYQERLSYIETILEFTAIRRLVKNGFRENDKNRLFDILNEVRKQGNIEILNATDKNGQIIVRSRNPLSEGDSVIDIPIIEKAIKTGKSIASTQIIQRKYLLKEGEDMAARAYIEIVPTEKAKPTELTEQKNGMMLLAAYPVIFEGKLLGVIYGGDLINRNYALVDKIKSILYRGEKYKGSDIGTATIFQNDVRISTNVMSRRGERAIGTRVSDVVRTRVLDKRKDWVDEAFVVNDWYITAYKPINDISGKVIGMLYVGILKKPFLDKKWEVTGIFMGIAILGVLIAVLVSSLLAARIARPLRRMRDVAREIAAGDYSKDISVKSQDVVGELADSFNTMTKKLIGVQKELENWVHTLEDRVEERTIEIKKMQKDLIQVEKMASVGRLAAGVAHEINNPLTGILTNASLLMEDFKEGSSEHEDLKTVVNETIRCRKIVKDLLDFSRQTKPEHRLVDINMLISKTSELVRNQISFKNIFIEHDLSTDLPEIFVDSDQITQVFMNILLNAADAMPKGGKISVNSKLSLKGMYVDVSIMDSGTGIDSKNLTHLFDPFFSTKSHGTGLGLAISYGIIEQHGGTIEVYSEKGKGSTFVIKLPLPEKGDMSK